MKNIINIYIFCFVSFVLSACSEVSVDADNHQIEQETYPVNFSYSTKATTDSEITDATLSVVIFPITSTSGLNANTGYGIYEYEYPSTNTYGFLDKTVALTPAASQSYYVNFASTGSTIVGIEYSSILPEQIPNYLSCYGYKINRTESVDAPNLYLSNSLYLSFDGLLVNNEYHLDLSDDDYAADAKLTKSVSHVEFQVKSISNLATGSEYTINSVEVSNLLNSIYYCPLHKYHYDAAPDLMSDNISLNKQYGSGSFTVGSIDAFPLYNGDNDYVEFISADYTEVATNGETMYPTPKLTVSLGSEGDLDIVTIPIRTNLEPQTIYTYTLTIATAYVDVEITAANWNDEDSIVGEVTLIDQFQISIDSDDSWDDKGDITTVI